jgi:hypothetical protein
MIWFIPMIWYMVQVLYMVDALVYDLMLWYLHLAYIMVHD